MREGVKGEAREDQVLQMGLLVVAVVLVVMTRCTRVAVRQTLGMMDKGVVCGCDCDESRLTCAAHSHTRPALCTVLLWRTR